LKRLLLIILYCLIFSISYADINIAVDNSSTKTSGYTLYNATTQYHYGSTSDIFDENDNTAEGCNGYSYSEAVSHIFWAESDFNQEYTITRIKTAFNILQDYVYGGGENGTYEIDAYYNNSWNIVTSGTMVGAENSTIIDLTGLNLLKVSKVKLIITGSGKSVGPVMITGTENNQTHKSISTLSAWGYLPKNGYSFML